MQQKTTYTVLEVTKQKIMKNTFYKGFFILLLTSATLALKGQTTIKSIINANDTWTAAGNPYLLKANAVIQAGVTVTIKPGVIIKSVGINTIYVNGELDADGTKDSVIVIDTAGFDIASTSVGYNFNTGKGTHFNYCYFNGSGTGAIYTIKKGSSNLLIQNSKFYNCYYSIYSIGASSLKDTVRVENTQFIGGKLYYGYAAYFSSSYTNFQMDECLVQNSYGMYIPNICSVTRSTFYNIQSSSGIRINAYGNTPYNSNVLLSCNTFRKFRGNIIDFYGLSTGNTVIINNNTFDSAENFLNMYMIYKTKPYSLYIYQNNFLYASKNAILVSAGSAPTTPDTLDFMDNYWGTTTTADIDKKIYDYNDNIVVPIYIDYSSYLSGMVTDCTMGDTQLTHQIAVKEIAQTTFQMVPNPANEKLNITVPASTNNTVYIRDISGAIVYQNNFIGNNNTIELNQFSSGIYYVSVQSAGLKAQTNKLVIQR